VHPKDSSAVAAILFEKGRSYFEYNQEEGFRVITEVEVKLKVYKKKVMIGPIETLLFTQVVATLNRLLLLKR